MSVSHLPSPFPHAQPDSPVESGSPQIHRAHGHATPFPHLEPELLQQFSANPGFDERRFLWSAVSEDWITWNAFHLLLRQNPQGWLQALGLASPSPVAARFWEDPAQLKLASDHVFVYVETFLRHELTADSLEAKLASIQTEAQGRASAYLLFASATPAVEGARHLRWDAVLGAAALDRNAEDSELVAGVKKELRRRVGGILRLAQVPTDADIVRGVLRSRRTKG